jgi:hypothetical protein
MDIEDIENTPIEDIKKLTGKVIIIGMGYDKLSAQYVKLMERARTQGFAVITADQAREAELNIPTDILKDHCIAITDIESVMPINPLVPLKELDLEIKMVRRDYEFDPTSVKRGKGKHRKTYGTPYKYHR